MKDRTINVNITKTLQEKQFEPIRISVSLGGNLAPDEDFDEETTEAIKKSTDNGREILMKLEKAGESENTKLGINPMPLFDYKAEALKTQY